MGLLQTFLTTAFSLPCFLSAGRTIVQPRNFGRPDIAREPAAFARRMQAHLLSERFTATGEELEGNLVGPS